MSRSSVEWFKSSQQHADPNYMMGIPQPMPAQLINGVYTTSYGMPIPGYGMPISQPPAPAPHMPQPAQPPAPFVPIRLTGN
jgi:hypothetical protein